MPMKPTTRITEAIMTSTIVNPDEWPAAGRLAATAPITKHRRSITACDGCTGLVAEDEHLVGRVELREGDAQGAVDFVAFGGEAIVDQGPGGLALRDAA